MIAFFTARFHDFSFLFYVWILQADVDSWASCYSWSQNICQKLLKIWLFS